LSATVAHPQQGLAGAGATRAEGRLERYAPWLIGLFTLLLLAATGEIVLDAAASPHSPLLPKEPSLTHWMSAVGEVLGFRVFLIALLVFTGAYVGITALARRLSSRWAIALVAALHLIVLAGPVLISTDVFSYIAYARMGVLHGINPYIHGPITIKADPVFKYIGPDWTKAATAYGPLYTLLSYPLASLRVAGAVWGMKLEALIASAGLLWLTWRCARVRGVDERFALLAVGANPLYVIYCLSGAHNDLIMMALMMLGVAAALGAIATRGASREVVGLGEGDGLRDPPPEAHGGQGGSGRSRTSVGGLLGGRRREGFASAAIVAAALTKATGIVPLPFLVLSRRRLAPLIGAVAAAAAGLLVAYAVFGVNGTNVISALNRDAAFVSTDGFPTVFAHMLGKPGVYPVDHLFLKAALALIVVYLMWRTWRGYDWVAASGWTLLAICVTNAWLLAWYTLWCLPFAVVSRHTDRRLLYAVLAVQGLYVLHQISPILAPVS
jgi:hypothetical protein